jgi:hypothetical protein
MPAVDLFLTKKEMLENWMRQKGFFATHEVIEWGTRNYYNRSAQTKGDMRISGIIRKLDDGEKAFRGFKCKDEVYEYVGER